MALLLLAARRAAPYPGIVSACSHCYAPPVVHSSTPIGQRRLRAPPRPAPTLHWPAWRLRQSCAPVGGAGRDPGGVERKCGCAGFRGRWCDVSRAWRSRKRRRSRPDFPAPAPAPFPLPPCSTSSPFFPKAGSFSGAFRE